MFIACLTSSAYMYMYVHVVCIIYMYMCGHWPYSTCTCRFILCSCINTMAYTHVQYNFIGNVTDSLYFATFLWPKLYTNNGDPKYTMYMGIG